MKQLNIILFFLLALNNYAAADTIQYQLESQHWSRQPSSTMPQQSFIKVPSQLCPETLALELNLNNNSTYSISSSLFEINVTNNFGLHNFKNIDNFASTILPLTPGHFAGLPLESSMKIYNRTKNYYLFSISREEGLFSSGGYSTWGGPMAWSITLESDQTQDSDKNKNFIKLSYVFHHYVIREDIRGQDFYTNAKYFANCMYTEHSKK